MASPGLAMDREVGAHVAIPAAAADEDGSDADEADDTDADWGADASEVHSPGASPPTDPVGGRSVRRPRFPAMWIAGAAVFGFSYVASIVVSFSVARRGNGTSLMIGMSAVPVFGPLASFITYLVFLLENRFPGLDDATIFRATLLPYLVAPQAIGIALFAVGMALRKTVVLPPEGGAASSPAGYWVVTPSWVASDAPGLSFAIVF